VAIVPRQIGRGRHREVDLDLRARKADSGGEHPDDGVGPLVEYQGLTDDGRVAAEPVDPERMADHRERRPAAVGRRLVRGEEPPDRRGDA
jgi:hypothetical protein